MKRLAPSSANQPSVVSNSCKKNLVLLADDEEPILRVVKELLTHKGYGVITASDGAQALEQFAQNIDDIKVIIMDMNMPVMDGLLCIKKLKQMKSLVKIIAVSGMDGNQERLSREQIDIYDFVLKPYCVDKLADKIKSAMEAA